MKTNLWRIAHNCLPTGDQLQKRTIPTRYDCTFCSQFETVEHCFLHCHYVKEIWNELKKSHDISLRMKRFSHIRQWLLEWIDEATDYQLIVFAVAAWHIWECRNNVRNGENLPHPIRVAGKINAYIDFIMSNIFRMKGSIRRENQVLIQKWSPPPEGSVMINIDAAVFSQTQRMGIGVVIRNHLGQMLAACRRYVNIFQHPELAEAIAMRHALNFAKDAGFQKIIVASDCANLISKVKCLNTDRSQIGVLVHDIKDRASKFISCNFIHVKRCCNMAAHVLARSSEFDHGSWWLNDIPSEIRTIVCTEQLLIK